MSEFLGISRGIVEDFLQTAVFLDDRPVYKFHLDSIEEADSSIPTVVDSEFIAIAPSISSVNDDESENDLDAQTIVDTFMQKGIVCSVIKCEEMTFADQRRNYIKLMKKTDIVVLDWDLFKDGGENVTSVVKELVQIDELQHELRSIIIYTANDLETVKTRLNAEGIIFGAGEYISHNNLYTTISLWNKKSKDANVDRTAEFNDLVEKCIDEFTDIFHGIVPNVAMAAIAEVRKNTHKLLGVMNKELDPAYLSHRSLLESPEDAERHIEEILIGEIESMIRGSEIGKFAKIDNLKKAKIIQDKKYQRVDFIQCLEYSTEKKIITGKRKTEKANKLTEDVKQCFTKEWFGEEEKARESEKNFAVLTSIVTEYVSNPYLTLGAIIEKSSEKFLCLQPRCDSIGLKKKTNFIFLKLIPDEEKFDIVLRDGSKYKIKYSLQNRQNFLFNPDVEGKKVLFSNLKNMQDDVEFTYIASLKRLHAQRIANEFSAYISRVGLNESEYIRRNSPRTLAAKI